MGYLRIILFSLMFAVSLEMAIADDYATTSEELEQLQGQIRAVQSGLDQERRRQDRLTRELRRLDEQVSETQRRIRALHDNEARVIERIAELQREHDRLSAQLVQHRDVLERQMLEAYVSGRQEYLRLLLNQEDPNRVDRLLVYLEYLSRARGERIREASARIQRLHQIEDELGAERRALSAAREQQQQARANLEQTRAERRRLLVEVEEQVAARGQQLARLRADENQLQQLLSGLREALADIPDAELTRHSFRERRGTLGWPIQGEVGARFGESRGIGDSQWSGVLIHPATSTDVRAVAHGRVVFSDWLRGFGLMVIIDHGEGFMSLYGHNDSLYYDVGAWVRPGDVVATVGSYGNNNRAGLYFEIRVGGRPEDPLAWLQ